MEIYVRNNETRETRKVSNTKQLADGRIVGKYEFGTRYYNTYPFMERIGAQGEQPLLQVIDGWSTISKEEFVAAQEETPQREEETPESVAVVEEEPKREQAQPVTPSQAQVQDAFAALTPLFAGVQANVEQAVMEKLAPVIAQLSRQAQTQTQRLEVVQKGDEDGRIVEGVFCEDFADIVQDVADGFYPYLWGAAGCGKTHTAGQVAQALGLDFYPQTTVQFAHDVRGYGDAAGNFVPTPFYKAFANGGIYFQDEYDRSAPEAAVVLNTALASGYYDFPVVGRVEAHPNFRFMAAGNTQMKGGDEEYVSGQAQDASSRDRVFFYEMHYDRRIELPIMAGGDEELCDFVEDVRRAIRKCGIQHVVSYRETKYMHARDSKKEAALVRSTFKGLERDEIRMIYGELQNKENAWAVALSKLK